MFSGKFKRASFSRFGIQESQIAAMDSQNPAKESNSCYNVKFNTGKKGKRKSWQLQSASWSTYILFWFRNGRNNERQCVISIWINTWQQSIPEKMLSVLFYLSFICLLTAHIYSLLHCIQSYIQQMINFYSTEITIREKINFIYHGNYHSKLERYIATFDN